MQAAFVRVAGRDAHLAADHVLPRQRKRQLHSDVLSSARQQHEVIRGGEEEGHELGVAEARNDFHKEQRHGRLARNLELPLASLSAAAVAAASLQGRHERQRERLASAQCWLIPQRAQQRPGRRRGGSGGGDGGDGGCGGCGGTGADGLR